MSETKSHPKGLYLLFVTEMWERFSYYGMRALFALFMGKALLYDKGLSSQIYGSYTGLVYLTPLIGGYMADRYWGNRKSIIIGGLLMALGQFFMFLSGSLYHDIGTAQLLMFTGLGFLIFGNGFFKPNISTMVGQLYVRGDKRIDSAFTIFYMGINLGAFFAPLVCGYLGDTDNSDDFKWGFLAACVGMLISIACFVWLKNKYIVTPEGEQIGVRPNKHRTVDEEVSAEAKSLSSTTIFIWVAVAVVIFWFLLFGFDFSQFSSLFAQFKKTPLIFTHTAVGMEFDLIGSVIFSLAIAIPGLIISDPSLTKVEKSRISVIYIACFFVIFFWSAFEQAGVSLTYFAEEQTNRNLFGLKVPASYFQSINAVAIVIFAPIFAWLWTWLGNRNAEPASPFKQSIGLMLLALGYLVIAFGVKGLQPGIKVSMIWLITLYTIHTFGELCLSPIGLSMVNKLAPIRLAALLMGVWFLANATANKFAGTLSGLYPEPLVPTEVVQTVSAANNVVILKDNAKIDVYNGKQTYTMEMLNFSKIKDENVKHNVTTAIEAGSIIKEKKFAGFIIDNLYKFFLIFVFMAGIASIILFIISFRLVKMMEGIK